MLTLLRSLAAAAALAAAALIVSPGAAHAQETVRAYDLAQLAPEVREAVETARHAQLLALQAAARSEGRAPGTVQFTGVGGDSYMGECAPCAESVQRHGYGFIYWNDGEYYAGEHRQGDGGGVKTGYGVYVFVDGRSYEGHYENDQQSGYGVYWDPQGRIIQAGYWENGRLTREGIRRATP